MNKIKNIRFFGQWQVFAAQAIPAERCAALENNEKKRN